MIMPIARLSSAARKASPNDSFRACRVRRLVTMVQNWSRLSSNVFRNSPASGISTMIDSHVSVSPMLRPKPGKVLRRFAAALTTLPQTDRAGSVLVDLIEYAAFAEMFLLRFRPAAEHIVDREQLHLREGCLVRPGNLRIARTIEVACGNFLSFSCIPVFQVSLCRGAGAFFAGNRIDHGDRRFGEDGA